MSTIKDKFGRREGSASFRNGDMEPYIVEGNSATGTTYICYTDDATRAIRKITESTVGNTTTATIEVAFGAWADRASLTYQPVNKDLSV